MIDIHTTNDAAEPTIEPRQCDLEFIKNVEANHFRTEHDTGANQQALMIWNIVRQHFGQPRLSFSDLPAWCLEHNRYHLIRPEYGCKRVPQT